jgi:hypothetical protein
VTGNGKKKKSIISSTNEEPKWAKLNPDAEYYILGFDAV